MNRYIPEEIRRGWVWSNDISDEKEYQDLLTGAIQRAEDHIKRLIESSNSFAHTVDPIKEFEDLTKAERQLAKAISEVQAAKEVIRGIHRDIAEIKALQKKPRPTIEGAYGFRILEETDEYLLVEPKPAE